MSNFANHSIAKQTYHSAHVEPGKSFVVVSGLGGDSIRPWFKDLHWSKWWASTAALDIGVNYGALLCTLQEPTLFDGQCEFRDIDGNTWDRFKVSVALPSTMLIGQRRVPIPSGASRDANRLRIQFTAGLLSERTLPLTVWIPMHCSPAREFLVLQQTQKTRRCAHKEFAITLASLTQTLEWTSPEIFLHPGSDSLEFKTDSKDWSIESIVWV
jgi:hypothetical protein